MRARLAPLIYDDDDREAAVGSAPASSPRRSVRPPPSARKPPASLRTACRCKASRVCSPTSCRIQAATALNQDYVFTLYSRPTATQARAFELLGVKPDRTQ
jgi:hypothetical protein